MSTLQSVKFTVGCSSIDVPIDHRYTELIPGLPNAGYIDGLDHMRGGWPDKLNPLTSLGITSVTSLISTNDEAERALELGIHLRDLDISHTTATVSSATSFMDAALAHAHKENQGKTYLHCSEGANRTSIVSTLFVLHSYFQEYAQPAPRDVLCDALAESIGFGFDYDKTERMKSMSDALKLANMNGWVLL